MGEILSPREVRQRATAYLLAGFLALLVAWGLPPEPGSIVSGLLQVLLVLLGVLGMTLGALGHYGASRGWTVRGR